MSSTHRSLERRRARRRGVPGRGGLPAGGSSSSGLWSSTRPGRRIVVSAGLWPIVRAHWPIALAMAGGRSSVARARWPAEPSASRCSSTCSTTRPGWGGTSAWPSSRSAWCRPASTFSLDRRRVEWRILRFALIGAAVVAMPLGMSCIAPYVADFWVKLLFSVVYASFGLLHLARLGEIVANHGPSRTRFAADPAIGFIVGVLGGLLASIIGVGADILLYGILVLALPHRSQDRDPHRGHPDGVHLAGRRGMCRAGSGLVARQPEHRSWTCSPTGWPRHPVVAVGGPLGSLVSRFVPRTVSPGLRGCSVPGAVRFGRVITSTSSARCWCWRRSAWSRRTWLCTCSSSFGRRSLPLQSGIETTLARWESRT